MQVHLKLTDITSNKLNNMNSSLNGKIALVTGAAAGIGKATAVLLAKHGATVILSDVNTEQGLDVAESIKKSGAHAEFMELDVGNKEQIKEVISAIVSQYGKLDIAVNNAGIGGDLAPLHLVTQEHWDRMMAINLSGQFYCLQAEITAMLKNGGGSIVNVASLAGLIGVPNGSPYSASKHGLIALTKSAAKEYAGYNIRVNAVCPGFIETNLLHNIPREALEFNKKFIVPMKRLGEAEEVAQTIAYLLSDAASYVTGTSITIDGGSRA